MRQEWSMANGQWSVVNGHGCGHILSRCEAPYVTKHGLQKHNHHQTLETLRDPVIKFGNSNQFHYYTTRGSNGRTIFV